MDNQDLMSVHAEVISLIFSYLILDAHDFSSFAKLFFVWERNRASSQIKFVLEKLDWDRLYQFHQHPMEVTRDQFLGFINYSVKHNVVQALFFNSTQKLFMNQNVQHHLGVLSSLAGTHFPSRFSILFFKAIYRQSQIDSTAQEIFQVVNTGHLRSKVGDLMDLLQGIYEYLYEIDYLLPVYKICPNARDRYPMLKIDSHTNEEELWNSLCHNAVVERYRDDCDFFGKSLKLSHIWISACQFCTLQLILYKILLGVVRK